MDREQMIEVMARAAEEAKHSLSRVSAPGGVFIDIPEAEGVQFLNEIVRVVTTAYLAALEAAGVVMVPVEPTEADIEQAAKDIAVLHGGKILFRDSDGAVTVAGLRNTKWRNGWAESVHQYAERHWQEYTGAAAAMLAARPK